MSLILGNAEGWKLYARLTDGAFLFADPTDKVAFAGSSFGSGIVTQQDSTHVATSGDVHRCTGAHVNNAKYLSDSTVSVNGAASAPLPVSASQCPLLFVLLTLEEVAVQSGGFYAYGSDPSPVANANVWAVEAGQSTWQNVNGGSNELALQAQADPATDHDFNLAVSYAPTATGSVSGTMKIRATYI